MSVVLPAASIPSMATRTGCGRWIASIWRASSSRTRWRTKARSFRPNGTIASLVIARRRATQHVRLLIREPDLQAIVGSRKLVIADSRQQTELHQLDHHDSAA